MTTEYLTPRELMELLNRELSDSKNKTTNIQVVIADSPDETILWITVKIA